MLSELKGEARRHHDSCMPVPTSLPQEASDTAMRDPKHIYFVSSVSATGIDWLYVLVWVDSRAMEASALADDASSGVRGSNLPNEIQTPTIVRQVSETQAS